MLPVSKAPRIIRRKKGSTSAASTSACPEALDAAIQSPTPTLREQRALGLRVFFIIVLSSSFGQDNCFDGGSSAGAWGQSVIVKQAKQAYPLNAVDIENTKVRDRPSNGGRKCQAPSWHIDGPFEV